MKRILIIAALTLAPAFAQTPANSPRMLVNLLDYVSQDYAGAVENGQVKSQSEYEEQIEFTETALKQSEALGNPSTPAKVQKLLALVKAKARPEAVAKLAQEIKREVIQVARITVTPSRWPDLSRGKALFAQNCALCHGAEGHGDGPGGAALNPKPADFHKPEMATRTPFREFNVIREGVPGTGMVGWPGFKDQQAWDLAFYVLSLRHGGPNGAPGSEAATPARQELLLAATQNDDEITSKRNAKFLAVLRTHSERSDDGNSLGLARQNLKQASVEYARGAQDEARRLALSAYLDGVEPVEPRLRANAPGFVPELEGRMAAVRGAIEGRKTQAELDDSIVLAQKALDQADATLTSAPPSPWLTFALAAGILLREGFEAVLILLALLAVIRASSSSPDSDSASVTVARRAARFVHAGWISALVLGGLAWIFSGWLMGISGAQRELLEGVTSLLAVLVLLYMGFWLHSRTEINRWNRFISGRVREALQGGNLFGLAALSFAAVFREAFETVLFLRAIWLDVGDAGKSALAMGVFGSLAALLVMSWMLLRFSAKLPIRAIFSVSSGLMAVLAFILVGKAFHSLQETGMISVTWLSWGPQVSLLGLFPSLETLLAQLVILGVCGALYWAGSRPTPSARAAAIPAR